MNFAPLRTQYREKTFDLGSPLKEHTTVSEMFVYI